MKGFTLFEIIIVIAIIVIIFGFGAVVGMDFYQQYSFETEKNNLVTILRKARSRAMANINQSNHGIYINANQYVIFQGSSYAGRVPDYDQVFDKNAGFSLSGLNEIVFEKFRGSSSASGTINLIDPDSGKTKIVEINYEGRIN